MIINTSQEFNLVNCCGCSLPSCEAPRLSCESISVNIDCGFQLPTFEGLSASDYCKRYAKRTSYFYYEVDQNGPVYGPGNEYDYHDYERSGGVCEVSLSGGECNIDLKSYYIDDDEKFVDKYGGVAATDWQLTRVYTYPAENGETTYTDNIDPVNNYDESFAFTPNCSILFIAPGAGWTYAGGTFTTISGYSESLSGVTTSSWSGATISYSDEIDAAWIASKIEELSFPDDVNGSSCSSSTVKLSACDEIVSNVTRSRYKMGVPSGYSSLSATRSTYIVQWCEVFVPRLSGSSPVLVAERDWIWGGSMEDPWSEWFILNPPAESGQVVICNILTKCYNSTRLGSKPTSHGEIIEV